MKIDYTLDTLYNGLKRPIRSGCMSDEQLLTVEQVAKQMQVHVETVRVWIRRGELIAINIGNEYRITRSDLDDFLERRKTDKRKKE